MIVTTFDSNGNSTGSSGSLGGGGSSVSKSAIKMGNFWSNGTMPTSDASFIDVLQQYNQSTVAAIESSYTATGPGYINVLTLYANGPTTSSNAIATVYKNGTALTIQATAYIADGNPAASFYGNGGPTFTFVKGDLIKVKIKSTNSSLNQSFSAGLEVINT